MSLDALLELPPDAASVSAARRFLRERLRQWEIEDGLGDAADTAVLLLSELCTNALLHSRGAFTVALAWSGRVLRVTVCDSSPQLPVRQRFSPSASTGRGIGLLGDLARSWGSERIDGGKQVWFEVSGEVARAGHRGQP